MNYKKSLLGGEKPEIIGEFAVPPGSLMNISKKP
jgi:hypothetical protein